MPADFRDSADRHYEDANYMFDDGRWASADEFYGISAECALKAVMLSLGMGIRPDGKPSERQHVAHIDKLWDVFITFANSRSATHYSDMLDSETNPFMDWDVSGRYEHRSSITEATTRAHRNASEKTLVVISYAVLDGGVE